MVRSNSEEAAQYWEKGAIIIKENDPPQFQTCTSRIYYPENFNNTNLYENYESFDMYQIIRKDALKDGKPVFYNEAPNPPNHFNYYVRKHTQYKTNMGGQYTVNSNDKPILENEFKKEIGKDNYDKFLEIISVPTEKNYMIIAQEEIQDLTLDLKYTSGSDKEEVLEKIKEIENNTLDMAKKILLSLFWNQI